MQLETAAQGVFDTPLGPLANAGGLQVTS